MLYQEKDSSVLQAVPRAAVFVTASIADMASPKELKENPEVVPAKSIECGKVRQLIINVARTLEYPQPHNLSVHSRRIVGSKVCSAVPFDDRVQSSNNKAPKFDTLYSINCFW